MKAEVVAFDGDTMAVHVPVTKEAKQEAYEKLLPSQNLFKPGHGDFMYMPSMEQIMGLYLMTKPDSTSEPEKSFSTKDEALKAYKEARRNDEKWSLEDLIEVGGKRMTMGQLKVNEILPDEYEEWDEPIDEDYLEDMFQEMNEDEDVTKQQITTIADKLKDLGNKHCYKRGFTVGLSDLEVDYGKRDKIYGEALEKVKDEDDPKKLFEEFSKAEEQVVEEIKKENEDNSFIQMAASGAKGGDDNLRSILAGPGLLTDNKGDVVETPVTTSYAEGIDSSDYWTSMYGARKGMIDRAKSTAEPGAFTKELINNTLDQVITTEDCKTLNGKTKSIDNRNIKGRVLAENTSVANKGDILDSHTIKELKKSGVEEVKVRSPLKCEADKGLCAKCYGTMPDGSLPDVGENIGVIAGHAMTEPSTQMTICNKVA